jgi:hypothetical protein
LSARFLQGAAPVLPAAYLAPPQAHPPLGLAAGGHEGGSRLWSASGFLLDTAVCLFLFWSALAFSSSVWFATSFLSVCSSVVGCDFPSCPSYRARWCPSVPHMGGARVGQFWLCLVPTYSLTYSFLVHRASGVCRQRAWTQLWTDSSTRAQPLPCSIRT